MSVFYAKKRKNSWASGGYAPRPPGVPSPLCQILGAPLVAQRPLEKSHRNVRNFFARPPLKKFLRTPLPITVHF